LIACGEGKLAHVNLQKGIYSRFLIASEQTKYLCAAGIGDNVFCVGTDDGAVLAIDFLSNREIGSVSVDFPVRGLLHRDKYLIAYGGSWNSRGSSIAAILWQKVIHNGT
jgi:hypothetical protein